MLKPRNLLLIPLLVALAAPLWAAESHFAVLQRHITLSNNDAEEHMNGTMDPGSSDLEMTWEEDVQTVGLRFLHIDIPKGATIIKAWIQFEVDEPSDDKTTLNIYVEENANPPLFLNTPFNISKRKRSKKKVTWKPAPWRSVDARGEAQRTPDLASLVQYMTGRKEWVSGNSMVFIIKGAGKRVAKAFTDNTENAIASTPTLHIAYTTDILRSGRNAPPEVRPPSPLSLKLRINEILTSNATVNFDPDRKEFSDWIELYNDSNQTVDLSGFYLSDTVANPRKWRVPDHVMIKPYSHFLIWADKVDGRLKALHTNFKLGRKGGIVLFSDADGLLIDKLRYPKQRGDISYGRSNKTYHFMVPTPGSRNASCEAKCKRTKKPKFSLAGGFYNAPVKIAFKHERDTVIYFTLDGSYPNRNSRRYTHPFMLFETAVVRAVAVGNGMLPSRVRMHTYLIDENVTLPVVSIGVDKKYLYDKEIGIVANYEKRWMREASVEYLIKGHSEFTENAGLKISGNNTRGYPQKSLALYFGKRYGPRVLRYPLFEDKPEITKIKSFTLRNSGTYWGRSLIAEGISHQIVMKNMDIDAQSWQPAVLFVNGVYQGIYNIRERMNKDYIGSNYQIEGNIDLIEHDETFDLIKAGNIAAWYDLLDQMRTLDTGNDENYEKIVSSVDVDEFIDHFIAESYFGNSSIQHNVKHWRVREKGSRWRSMLFDLDRGFDQPSDPVLGYLMDQSSTNIPFTSLLGNSRFRVRFLSRYFTHLNTTFQPERVGHFIDAASGRIEPEIERHFEKWRFDYDGNPVSPTTWRSDIESLHRFAREREALVRRKLRETFALEGAPVLSVASTGNGSISIDGVVLDQTFSGSYFNGAAITLRAIPRAGCSFDSWSGGDRSTTLQLILDEDRSITAAFHCK